MKLFKNGTIILIVGVIGLLAVIGVIWYDHYEYLKSPESDTPQEIAEMKIEPININTASADELSSLPGLSEKQAQSIVDYREKNGSFASAEDVMKVKGIGKKAYQRIALYIATE